MSPCPPSDAPPPASTAPPSQSDQACGGNCCSSAAPAATPEPAEVLPANDDEASCPGACCSPAEKPVSQDEPAAGGGGCDDACCASDKAAAAATPKAEEEKEEGPGRASACCADDANRQSSCCSAAPAPGATTTTTTTTTTTSQPSASCPRPACCGDATAPSAKGKKRQCCDDGCLDELALRACDAEKCAYGSGGGGASSSACDFHRKKTRSQYRASLDALGCICRALLARNLESCCSQTATLRRRRAARPSSRASSSARGNVKSRTGGSCCAERPAAGKAAIADCGDVCSAKKTPSVKAASAGCGDGCCGAGSPPSVKAAASGCKDTCCSAKPPSLKTASSGCKDACCGGGKPPSVKAASSGCKDACCGGKPPSIKTASSDCKDACCDDKTPSIKSMDSCGDGCCAQKPVSVIDVNINQVDVERGDSEKEHIVLTVHGMTCTGCETKLMRSLAVIPGVTRPQTSLLLSRAEFDLNGGVLSADQVQARLEKETGFHFDKVAIDDEELETLEILTGGDSKAFVTRDMPEGVVSASVVDKNTVSLQYDPKVLGARDLIDHSFSAPLQLAPLRPPPAIASGRKHVWNVGLQTLVSALLIIPVLFMAWAPLPENQIAYGSASLALATIIQVFIAGPFYSSALRSLIFSRVIEMDLLIVLSTTAAYVFSIVAFAYLVVGSPLSTGEFFETSTLLVTLIMVGRFLGALARQKAVESVSVLSLQPSTAILSSKDGQIQDEEIDARLLQFGDVFKVLPETRIPTDGTIISGISEVDESMITGESRPVSKEVSAAVIGGSVNGSGALLVRVSRLPGSNTVAKIAAMVDEAKMSKPKIQDLADKVASWFVPVVVAITIITFVAWVGVGINKQGLGGSEAAVQAITYAIATLIVSCPCAIGLAVPMVVVMTSGIAAENGVVVKNAETLEIARKTSHVVFDKTGTLTQGKLSVVQEVYPDDAPPPDLSLLLGLVRGSKHPVSTAVATYLESKGTIATPINDIQSLPGKGLEATLTAPDSTTPLTLRAGNSRWLSLSTHPTIAPLLSSGATVFCFATDTALRTAFALHDRPRPDAAAVVARLHALSIAVSLVSGDDDAAVHAVAADLGIPPARVRSRASPAEKQQYVKDLFAEARLETGNGKKQQKQQQPTIVFVGDGTNDSVALAQASIGVHVGGGQDAGGGTDVAAAAADVVLLSTATAAGAADGSLRGVLTLLGVSRAAFRRIVANFGWSFVYNVFAILLAAGAFPGSARIPPQFAGLGEVVSVVPVVLVAVQLRFVRRWD